MAGSMTNEEYLDVQMLLLAVTAIILKMDLAEFLERIERAETMGPIMDPTLYMHAADKLGFIRRIAEAAKRFQNELRALKKQTCGGEG